MGQLLQLGFVAAAALGVFSFVRTGIDAEQRRMCTPLCAMGPQYAARNRLAPDFELPKLGGGTARLSDYRGQVVVLNFWTKNCQPCLDEMPALEALSKRLETDPGKTLITVTIDESTQDADTTLRSVLGHKPTFTVLIDPQARVVTDLFGTKLFPETWFIDPEGVIRARIDGARQWDGPMPVDLADALKSPSTCSIEFVQGQPQGKWAWLCSDAAAF